MRGTLPDNTAKTVQVSEDGAAHVVDGGLTWLKYQRLAALATAVTLSPPTGARYAWITAEGGSIRLLRDASDATNGLEAPTSINGMPILEGQHVRVTCGLTDLKIIENTASAIAHVAYFG